VASWTEGLSRLGYNVTGLDPNPELIDVAKFHVKDENIPQLQYECSTIEEFGVTNSEKYNVVVSSETIEHVTEKEEFLKSSIQCLKPGGSLFITTINKTWLGRFSAIYLWENVFKCVPKGTHEYDKFIGLNDLIEMLSKGR
jgi:ubiquinone biosynthesis O-methyltransferase